MSTKVLNLDAISLSSAVEDLKVTISCAVDFAVPPNFANSDAHHIVQALTSGKLWASRGNGCHIGIQILLDGRRMKGYHGLNLLDTVGNGLLNAEMWQRLRLSAAVEINSDPHHSAFPPDLFIKINHALPVENDANGFRVQDGQFPHPQSLISATIDKIQLRFDFERLGASSERNTKRIKPKRSISPDVMLLEDPRGRIADAVENLETVVDSLQKLPGRIQGLFDVEIQNACRQNQSIPRPMTTAAALPHSAPIAPFSIPPVKKGRLPKVATDILFCWWKSHLRLPTKTERRELLNITSLTSAQLSRWMYNNRQRIPPDADAYDTDEMLFLPEEQTSTLEKSSDHASLEEDMVFSRSTYTPSSLTSQSSVTFSDNFSALSLPNKKRQFSSTDPGIAYPNGNLLFDLEQTVARFTETAFRILIAGYSHRLVKLTDIQADRPAPETFLSSLVPSLFCPEFRKSTNSNARFIDAISHSMSQATRNAQSPTLKQKLIDLANSTPAVPPLHENFKVGNQEHHRDMVRRATKNRIWGMARRKMYDPTAVRRLLTPATPNCNGDNDDDPELLFLSTTTNDEFEATDICYFSDEDAFDLLEDDQDDLLSYLEDSGRERLELERETDEMMFRGSWDDLDRGEPQDLLCGDEVLGEQMLLDTLIPIE